MSFAYCQCLSVPAFSRRARGLRPTPHVESWPFGLDLLTPPAPLYVLGLRLPIRRLSGRGMGGLAIPFNPKGEIIIANADKDGYTGALHTLPFNVEVKLIPNDKGDTENAPDFHLQAAGHEIGAAWKKTSQPDRPYLSVSLDAPSFPATVYARLIENEDGTHDLIAQQAQGDLTTTHRRIYAYGAPLFGPGDAG